LRHLRHRYQKIVKGLLPGPRVFGHEICGTVARTGARVSRFREGDRVVVHHHVPCGRCFYCSIQAYAQCETYKRNGTTAGFEASGGGFAEYVKAMDWIVERGAIPVPDGVLPEEAAFVEPVNTCLKAVRKAGVEKGQTVLVVGQGPIGLLLMQLCRWAGADVLVSDTFPDRLEMARRLGASVALDATAVDVPREIRALTGGAGPTWPSWPPSARPHSRRPLTRHARWPYHRLRRHIPWRDGPDRLGGVERRREGDPHVVQRIRGRPGPGRPARLRARRSACASWSRIGSRWTTRPARWRWRPTPAGRAQGRVAEAATHPRR
jgi:hypothetical protein